MGIRTDSDLQQPSVEGGHNPYTQEDMAIYTPQQIDSMCEQQETLCETIEAIRSAIDILAAGIDNMAPLLKNVCDQIEKLEQVAQYEELL